MRRIRWVVAVLAVALVAAACGGRDDDEAATEDEGRASTETTAKASEAAAGDFGDLKGVCGPGDAKGATDKGVTDTEIKVGTLADPGSTVRPGLNQEMFDAASAFVKWCNEAGGILGRKLSLTLRDAKLFEVQARIAEACQSDFMLVGGGTALDDAGVDTRVACGLPDIPGFANSPKATEAPLQVQPTPTPVQKAPMYGVYRAIAAKYPNEVKKMGFLTSNLPGVKITRDRAKEAAEAAGYTVVYNDEHPLAVDNWRPFVENMRSKGVEAMHYVGEPANWVAISKAMKDVGWEPKVTVHEGNFYDQRMIEEGGTSLPLTYVRSFIHPLEDPEEGSATAQFLEIMEKHVPGGKVASLGVNTFSAYLMFAQAAKACGSQLTRQCVLDNAAKVTEWTGGGLHGTTSPSKRTEPCFAILEATPEGFKLVPELTKPNEGIFNCSDDNVYELKTDYRPK